MRCGIGPGGRVRGTAAAARAALPPMPASLHKQRGKTTPKAQQDRTGFEQPERLTIRSIRIEDGGDFATRIQRQELRRLLVVLVEVDEMHFIRQPDLLQHDRELDAIRRRQRIELKAVGRFCRPARGDWKSGNPRNLRQRADTVAISMVVSAPGKSPSDKTFLAAGIDERKKTIAQPSPFRWKTFLFRDSIWNAWPILSGTVRSVSFSLIDHRGGSNIFKREHRC